MAESIIIKGAFGINNKIDPMRHQYNPETGIGFLAEAIDCDIDDSGMISRRNGFAEVSANYSHSVFCDRGDCFVAQDRVSDTAIYKIGTDFSLVGVRSGLTKSNKISYCQVGQKTYYSNGVQNGVIIEGISTSWPLGVYKGPDTLKEYSQAPVGSHIAYHLGRMWIAVDSDIFVSEPFKPGLFRLAGRFFSFGTVVRMIRPVKNGVWVSDSETTGFISISETWDKQEYERKASIPAHEWSDNHKLVDLKNTQMQIPGLSAVWSSDDGLCIGTEDGQLINVTENKLIYPKGSSGATIINDHVAINTIY